MAGVSRIVFERERGVSVWCLFLTDGGASNLHGIRDRESSAVLTSLGVASDQILFLGSQIPIRAGTLVHDLDLALERLEQAMKSTELDRIYCLAWEGGNQDHDASHLVAAAFARRRGMLDRCCELPLYRGWVTRGPFFRVFSPLAPRREWHRRRLTLREGMRFALLPWRYRSQRRSWAGLFPEAFLKLAILRREVFRNVDPARFRQRPHAGALLYERRGRFSYERFARAAAAFLDQHFA